MANNCTIPVSTIADNQYLGTSEMEDDNTMEEVVSNHDPIRDHRTVATGDSMKKTVNLSPDFFHRK